MKRPNFKFFTLGGKVFWKTLKHKIVKRYRVLDKRAIRYHTSIDHIDVLNVFEQYSDKSINR